MQTFKWLFRAPRRALPYPVPEMRPAFQIGREFMKYIDTGVDQDGVRSSGEDGRPALKTLRPPHA